MSALWPTGKTTQPPIVRPYGNMLNPYTHVYSHHAGDDIAASAGIYEGTPIYAAATGTIIYSGLSGTLTSGYGNLIVIRTPDNYYYLYAHLETGTLKPLGPVTQGQIIGKCGHTGGATGPHSHFGTGTGGWDYAHLTDPVPFMAARNIQTSNLTATPIVKDEYLAMAKLVSDTESERWAIVFEGTGEHRPIHSDFERQGWDAIIKTPIGEVVKMDGQQFDAVGLYTPPAN